MGPPRFTRLSVLATVSVLSLAGCGALTNKPKDPDPAIANSASPAASASASTSASTSATPSGAESSMAGHDHGGSAQKGGLTIGDPLPARDDPNHGPSSIEPQKVYALGQNSVFAIQGRRPDDLIGFGTGFLVDKAGQHAITNAHVVEGLAAMQGRFNDGTRSSLHVIATDPCTDLAVVHFSDPLPDKSEALVIGDSNKVQPGDEVFVLGFPGTLTADTSQQKLLITEGLVNGVKVPAQPPGLPEYKDTIQHGATINHGNSGGPLIDHHARVIGVNTLTNAGNAENQFYSIGISSAVPELMNKLLKGESVNDMGWAVDEYYSGYFENISKTAGPILDQQVEAQGIKGGLYVKAVTPGSGAAKAGVKPGMLLTRIQNTSVKTLAESCDIIGSILPGTVAQVEGIYLLSDTKRFTTRFSAEFTTPGKH